MRNEKKDNYLSFVINYNIILLIPMLMIMLSTFFVVRAHNLQRVMTEVRIKTESQNKYWNQEMSVLFLHYNNFRFSKLYSPAYQLGFPGSYLDIIKDLRDKEGGLPFVDHLYFYNRQEHTVFSSEGTYQEDYFFSRRCHMSRDILDEAVEDGMAVGHASFYSGSRDGIVLVFSLRNRAELERTSNGGQYVLVAISREKLSEQFVPRGSDGVTAITWKDNLIYQSSKVLETDKSPLEARNAYEIYSRDMANSFTVWNLVSKKEILRDSMQYLKSYVLWFVVSLVVGVLLAMFYSRRRYVMFHSLMNHSAALEDERNALQVESCLYELLALELQQGDALWRQCLESGVHIERPSQYIILFPKTEQNEALRQYFINMKRDDLNSSAYRIKLFGDLSSWLVLSCEDKAQIERQLAEFEASGAHFERGEIVSDAGKLKEEYEQVSRRLKLLYREEDYPRMELESLQEAIELGEDTRVEMLIRQLRALIEEADEVTAVLVSVETLHLLGIDFKRFYLMLRGRHFSGRDILRAFDSALEACRAEQTGQSVPAIMANHRKRSITDILSYLHEHYLEPGFSVKYMASYFDTSVSNLSHFFKKNMDESISSYVDRIKLDKAKQLLCETDMKIGEIAEYLQYSSSTGFVIMFKKYEGVTPKVYRDNNAEGAK